MKAKFFKVRQMQGKNSTVKNQFIIETPEGIYFQSYQKIIAFKPHDNNPIILDEKYWNYSRTTGKYRNLFLGEKQKETEKKIRNGIYNLANLNDNGCIK